LNVEEVKYIAMSFTFKLPLTAQIPYKQTLANRPTLSYKRLTNKSQLPQTQTDPRDALRHAHGVIHKGGRSV